METNQTLQQKKILCLISSRIIVVEQGYTTASLSQQWERLTNQLQVRKNLVDVLVIRDFGFRGGWITTLNTCLSLPFSEYLIFSAACDILSRVSSNRFSIAAIDSFSQHFPIFKTLVAQQPDWCVNWRCGLKSYDCSTTHFFLPDWFSENRDNISHPDLERLWNSVFYSVFYQ